ncbi:MAG TPA: protein-L-isoaspartate(D-aspartate) O-methyltransferase [Verrucomicrobiales bacterium]|nr:protein-L-isoaspartate(D-aspartate) O-methyltransferase [Verrucomicrobiales bacterium]
MKIFHRSLLVGLVFAMGCQAEEETIPGGSAGTTAREKFAEARLQMVATQLQGRGRNITNEQVLAAMGRVPRHELVPEGIRDLAYGDHPLPIGHGQTISQPYIVAFMTQALEPQSAHRVLEVGTGSGYQAAVLAELVKEVYTIEIVEPLGRRAQTDLARLGCTNVFVRIGDGYEGWPEKAPFDAVIVTCSPDHIPRPLIDQLANGGQMIIPVGNTWRGQNLMLLRKEGTEVIRKSVLPVRFVPMTGKAEE